MRITILLATIGAAALTGADAQAQSRVAAVDQLELHSSFWVNLHMTLYADAIAGLPAGRDVPRLVGQSGTRDLGALGAGERATWQAAVAFYAPALARRDLRVGENMTAIQRALVDSGDALRAAPAISDEHRAHLEAAAPIYRRHWWPAHDRAIRAWIADVSAKLEMLLPQIKPRQVKLLEAEWFTSPVRAEITYHGRTYTTLRPTLTTLAVVDPAYHGWAGAEMILHELSHALTEPLEARIRRQAQAAGKNAGDLWHVSMFFITGEVWRSELAARGISYSPYLYATGLFDRAWKSLRAPLEEHLRPYIDGRTDAETAYGRVIASLPDRK